MWCGYKHLWEPWLAFMWLLTGFCGLFCPMCLECDIARHYGECFCWPLLPGSTFALRIGTRERHKIRVSKCVWMYVYMRTWMDAFQTCDYFYKWGVGEDIKNTIHSGRLWERKGKKFLISLVTRMYIKPKCHILKGISKGDLL